MTFDDTTLYLKGINDLTFGGTTMYLKGINHDVF